MFGDSLERRAKKWPPVFRLTGATNRKTKLAALAALAALSACGPKGGAPTAALKCEVSLVVLGVAQDAGKPQIANNDDLAWTDPELRRSATSLALVDRRGPARRWLFEATPDLREQLHRLDQIAPAGAVMTSTTTATPQAPAPILDGIFLTHAHVGHYAGLMFLGRESAGASDVPVFAMPRMAEFLASNGPWSQLVSLKNITLNVLSEGHALTLADGLSVMAFAVPHRQEFSEVVGYRIEGPDAAAVFIPDIDRWEDWDAMGVKVEDAIKLSQVAFLDATFYSGDELPGRDMSQIPHPPVVNSMERFAALPEDERAKVKFIHMNHTNPLHDAKSPARAAVAKGGMGVAAEGEEYCL